MNIWVSDRGSHSKNKVMQLLAEEYKVEHHFVTAYSPWANGTVERVMREVRRAAEALLAEFGLGPQDWPHVISIIQAVMNSSPLKRLGKNKDGVYRSPLEVMTGLKPVRGNILLCGHGEVPGKYKLNSTRAAQVAEIDKLQTALDAMHKEVAQTKEKGRLKAIEAHNAKLES